MKFDKPKEVIIIALYIIICWIVVAVDMLLPANKSVVAFGIIPRQPIGIRGIFLWSFIHKGILMMAGVTINALIIGGLLLWRSILEFLSVSAFGSFFGGFIIWLIAPLAIYYGSATMMMSWCGYLVLAPYYERPTKVKSILIAILAAFITAAILYGTDSTEARGLGYWEAIVAGFLCGVLYAFLYHKVYLGWLKPRYSKRIQREPTKIEKELLFVDQTGTRDSSSSDANATSNSSIITFSDFFPRPQSTISMFNPFSSRATSTTSTASTVSTNPFDNPVETSESTNPFDTPDEKPVSTNPFDRA